MYINSRPETNEYPAYYEPYIAMVPKGDIFKILEAQVAEVSDILAGIDERNGDFAYAEGKWTIRELFVHLNDTERIFGYRALRFARMDATPLAGFEQDDYVKNAHASSRNLENLADEFYHLRLSNVFLFRTLTEEALKAKGTANGKEVQVRSIVYIMVGHVAHHLRILKERYLIAVR